MADTSPRDVLKGIQSLIQQLQRQGGGSASREFCGISVEVNASSNPDTVYQQWWAAYDKSRRR